jgi:hypothetical protein
MRTLVQLGAICLPLLGCGHRAVVGAQADGGTDDVAIEKTDGNSPPMDARQTGSCDVGPSCLSLTRETDISGVSSLDTFRNNCFAVLYCQVGNAVQDAEVFHLSTVTEIVLIHREGGTWRWPRHVVHDDEGPLGYSCIQISKAQRDAVEHCLVNDPDGCPSPLIEPLRHALRECEIIRGGIDLYSF